jgi:hypothetical protein
MQISSTYQLVPAAPQSSWRKASVGSGASVISQLHVALGIGEQDYHLLALAFGGCERREDVLGEVREHGGMG